MHAGDNDDDVGDGGGGDQGLLSANTHPPSEDHATANGIRSREWKERA